MTAMTVQNAFTCRPKSVMLLLLHLLQHRAPSRDDRKLPVAHS
jgi:hypothetical protein